MAAHHGKNGKVKLSSNAIGIVQEWKLSQKVGKSPSHGMGASWQDHLTDIPEWEGSVKCNFDPADTNGQVSLDIGETVAIGFYSDGDAASKKYFSGSASVVGIDHQGALTGAVSVEFSFAGKGALTVETVPA